MKMGCRQQGKSTQYAKKSHICVWFEGSSICQFLRRKEEQEENIS